MLNFVQILKWKSDKKVNKIIIKKTRQSKNKNKDKDKNKTKIKTNHKHMKNHKSKHQISRIAYKPMLS